MRPQPEDGLVMSATQTSAAQQALDLSYWAYSQAGTNYVDGPTQLPDGFSYLLSDGAPVIGYDPSTGFYGAALVSPAGQVVVAFEGTNLDSGNNIFTTAQAIDDAYITYGKVPLSFISAYDFTQTAIKDAEAAGSSPADIWLTGHSLGGADAEYVGERTGLAGITFGAPGIATPESVVSIIEDDDFSDPNSNFVDYVDRGDPVGNYAPDGNENPLLQAQTIAHYGQPDYVGPFTNATLLFTASVAYIAAQNSTSPTVAAADYAASSASLALAADEFHPLANYVADLGLPDPGASAGVSVQFGAGNEDLSASVTAGEDGGIDIPGLDIGAPGAVSIYGGSITITSDGQDYSLPLPDGTGETLSLTSDGQGGTLVSPGAASSGYVFAGQYGATVQGGAGSLTFVGGSGAVSVTGGSGNTTLVGSTGSTSVLVGGSGTNVITGGAGSSTLVGGTGASTLIGGSGSTDAFARGAAPAVLIGGAGASTIYGATGSGTEEVFTGGGVAFAGLDGAADTVVGGSGASSVVGGSGEDVFGFINGHAGGSMVIARLSPSDSIVFGDYSGDPITSEGVLDGSDLITLSDGTTILLQDIDHTVFKGLV
jgi:Ca2+-binding RTX toxin-like protein